MKQDKNKGTKIRMPEEDDIFLRRQSRSKTEYQSERKNQRLTKGPNEIGCSGLDESDLHDRILVDVVYGTNGSCVEQHVASEEERRAREGRGRATERDTLNSIRDL